MRASTTRLITQVADGHAYGCEPSCEGSYRRPYAVWRGAARCRMSDPAGCASSVAEQGHVRLQNSCLSHATASDSSASSQLSLDGSTQFQERDCSGALCATDDDGRCPDVSQ